MIRWTAVIGATRTSASRPNFEASARRITSSAASMIARFASTSSKDGYVSPPRTETLWIARNAWLTWSSWSVAAASGPLAPYVIGRMTPPVMITVVPGFPTSSRAFVTAVVTTTMSRVFAQRTGEAQASWFPSRG